MTSMTNMLLDLKSDKNLALLINKNVCFIFLALRLHCFQYNHD